MLIALFISDLLEGVDVNPERHTKKQSEHHMPSFGENKHNLFLTHCLAAVIQFSLIDIRGGDIISKRLCSPYGFKTKLGIIAEPIRITAGSF